MFRFTPRTIPNQIVVIGCGGTGSRLVPLLTQFIASITKDKTPRGWLDSPTIWLVDDDVVEAKNLLRQNFVAADIGKHKASVLAQRYGRAYGVNVLPILKRVDGTLDCLASESINPQLGQSIVIMCVDSAQARRDIIQTVNQLSRPSTPGQGAFFIDAGNEDNFGQVKFFNQACASMSAPLAADLLPKLSPVILDVPAIPIDLKYYDDLEDMPGQGSCADLDQTLAINAMMGAEIMGIVQNYFYVKPMVYNQISVSLDGARSTSYNTAAEFLRRAREINRNGNAHGIRRLSHSRFAYFDMAPLLNKFIKETEKALAAMMAPSTVAETAVETASELKAKRSRKKAEPVEVTAEPMPRSVQPAVPQPMVLAADAAWPYPSDSQGALTPGAREGVPVPTIVQLLSDLGDPPPTNEDFDEPF